MLLANWKESKNLGKKKPFKSSAWAAFSAFLLFAFEAHAEPQSLSNPTSILSIFLSLLLVIGVVFILAFLMRRFNVTQSGTSQLKVVTSMMAGAKERVLVIQVGDEQHLIGVTAHNINHLAKLAEPLVDQSLNNNEKFKDKLSQFMAGKLNPALANDQSQSKQSATAQPGAKK
jgi:flagellar protein FliO/FliZ